MTPLWKVRREVVRLAKQIRNFPAVLVHLPIRLYESKRRALYDLRFDQLTRLTEGSQTLQRKVAIFLIYQPNGLVMSIPETCQWLVSEGYAPFVVSNGPLDTVSRTTIAAGSWRLLERPNFGYDFGGYRDGIRLLGHWGISPERLIVMNDSFWIPMIPDLMTKLEARADEANIFGLLHDTKIIDGRSAERDTRIGYSYVESYFFLFDRETWESVAFQDFWGQYKMSDDKSHTIKFGEIGFSRAMAEAGLKLDGLCRRDKFLEEIRKREDNFLKLALQHAAYVDGDLLRESRRLTASNLDASAWRDAALDHIERTVRRRRFNSSFPVAHDHIFGTAFMKKNREPVWTEMRRVYLQALDANVVAPPPPAILDEIRAGFVPGTKTR